MTPFCEETGRPRLECRCWHCADTKGPETERIPPSMPAAAPLPCKLTYYGIDCTGCTAHPRGLTMDDVRRLRRGRSG